MFDSVALFIGGVPNLKDSNQMTRVLKECFIRVRSNRCQRIKPFFRSSLTIKCCSSTSASRRIIAFTSGELTMAKCQGCWLAPLGAAPAARMQERMASSSTRSVENIRTVLRERICSQNVLARLVTSSGQHMGAPMGYALRCRSAAPSLLLVFHSLSFNIRHHKPNR